VSCRLVIATFLFRRSTPVNATTSPRPVWHIIAVGTGVRILITGGTAGRRGGFLIVPAMVLLCGHCLMREAVGTSLIVSRHR
jgi:uncharacterized membrane protein YfcA